MGDTQDASLISAGVQQTFEGIVDHLREVWERIGAHIRPAMEAARAMVTRMDEQLRAAFSAVRDGLKLAFQAIRPAIDVGMAALARIAHYLYETSTERLAGRLRSCSNPRLDAAADFLERTDRTLSELPVVDEPRGSDVESYEAVIAMHTAVGALEEVACQVAGTPTSTLPKALRTLVRCGVISKEQAAPMDSLYRLHRNRTRGVGHGADAAPNVIAEGVMWQVRQSIFVLLNAAGIGTVLSPVSNRIEYRSSAALATGGA